MTTNKLFVITSRNVVHETLTELVRAPSEADALAGINAELVAVLDTERHESMTLDTASRAPRLCEIEQGVEPPPAEAVLDDVLAALRLLTADPDVDQAVADRIGGIIRAANVLTEAAPEPCLRAA